MKNPRAQSLLTAPSFLWMLVLFAWPAAHLSGHAQKAAVADAAAVLDQL
jgi:hypothetical protein